MKIKVLMLGVIILAALCASGCATRESLVGQFHGTAHQLAIYNQLANPGTEVSSEPVEGLEGKAVAHSHDRYIQTFEKPKAKEYTIGK